ncbi:beta-ketoacyl-ACP synthase III [Dactylosporangium sp. NPDC005555]|uniref:beta-ketoacyl-ACP synthase III n=1 Tax=Dactylosporangium sp. NPDC005555 TaxID=3154889 RepID=UPI0033AF284D
MDRVAVLAGLGAGLPSTPVTNSEIAVRLGIEPDWIETRTGIRRRYVVAPGESTGDLAVSAGRRALASAGTDTVDAVVLATSTPDRLCPATAPRVADILGLGTVAAFDVAAVCSGFIYALATGSGLIAMGAADTVLVIGADTFSTIVDPADRATSAIFGDGAGAAVLRAGAAGERGAVLALDLGSDGSRGDLIEVRGGGSRQRSTGLPAKEEDQFLVMQGQAVFAQAVQRMSASAAQAAARCGWSLDDVDWFVLHQANARIITAVARQLRLPQERFLSNIDRVGNTAAASIPLALADGVLTGRLRPGQRVVLTSFGGGLTWGSFALSWPRLTVGAPQSGAGPAGTSVDHPGSIE